MNLKELGQRLQQERERIGQSLDDISAQTCIAKSVLISLEEGDAANYPHLVYAKGFLRSYAMVLGMDAEDLIRGIDQHFSESVEKSEPIVHEKRRVSKNEKNRETSVIEHSDDSWVVGFSAVIFVIILSVLVWYFSFSGVTAEKKEHQKVESLVPQSEKLPAFAPIIKKSTQPLEDGTAIKATQDAPLSIQASASVDSTTAEMEKENPESDAEQARVSETTQLAQTTTEEPMEHELSIEGIGAFPCWIGVWLPDVEAIARDFIVSPGETIHYKFTGKRILRFGRVEAVRLIFDGTEQKVARTGVANLTLP